ncbi:MAG: carbamoyltransferase C-terminal domain-containing protein [Candidatus Cloacimonetes bacterium]|nr:carbamoyltransferase C-terminal domain-containing protein [Candidatus Cloacimonadota bacterium]
MLILGINAFGQNPSACLVEDGKLKAFSHEERFNRLKGSHGLFPSQALNWCLASNGLKLQHINRIAVNWDCHKYPFQIAANLAKATIVNQFRGKKGSGKGGSDGMGGVIENLNLYRPSHYSAKIRDALRSSGHRGMIPEIVFVNHHLSHAYQSYFQSGYRDAMVLVADGHGEDVCVTGYEVHTGTFTKVLQIPVPYSLGWFYGGFTAYLGFNANRDEGKLMGLAAYGEERMNRNPWLQRLDKVLKIEKDGYRLDPGYFKMGSNKHHPRFTDALADFICSYNANLTPIGLNERVQHKGKTINRYLLPEYIDLAYAVQSRLEDAVCALVKQLQAKTRLKKLCLAGGIFMNCKANGSIFALDGIDELFIHPASSDDGSAIGAAYWVSQELGAEIHDPLRHVQYGAAFSNDDIRNALEQSGLSYSGTDDPARAAAQLLAQGKYLGWFQGPAEMGARALGGRSIIACPNHPEVKDDINAKVKFRESWRPYCPSLTLESRGKYLSSPAPNNFMIRADYATELLKEHAAATVHVDNTVRPQTVSPETLPLWHRLIKETEALTGVPVLLNTSFNVRGEPIVNSPFDAIRTFCSTGLDALVIGNFLVQKKGSDNG